MMTATWLPVALGLVVALSVAMYVVADGFDLGVGILFPFAPSDTARDVMMNSVAPFWDGNETWLVLGGTLLIAAFPLAYATLLPALYVPLMLMLVGLILRGVAFEFRFRARGRRHLWDWAFSGGSALAALCQGVVLGGFIQGIQVANRAFLGGSFDFASPFALVCGLGLVAGYSLLGASWLVMKTGDETAQCARRAARFALILALAFVAIVSVWTPLDHPQIARRWFAWPNVAILFPVPIATVLVGYGIWRALAGWNDARPFVLSVLLFLLAFAGLGISLFPYAVPYTATLWDASSSEPTQAFVGVGTAVMLPIIFAYLGYAYWTFRDKTGRRGGYGGAS